MSHHLLEPIVLWARVATAAGLCAMVCVSSTGCIRRSAAQQATTRPVTVVPPEEANQEYWYGLPARYVVPGQDFDRLWDAARRAALARGFELDRTDYRAGIILTEPLTSAQWFEPWRDDVVSIRDRNQATLGGYRRTIRFEFTRGDDGTYTVSPKVLVERHSVQTRRTTSAVQYAQALQAEFDPLTGSRELDQGRFIPAVYWYGIARDYDLEQALADDIVRRL